MWCGLPPFSVCSSESNALHTDDYKVKSSPTAKAPLLYRIQRHRSEATIIANGADATNTYDTACPADSPTTEVDDDVRHSWSGSPLPMPTYVPEGAKRTIVPVESRATLA